MKTQVKILLITLGAAAFIFLLTLYMTSLYQPGIAHPIISSTLPPKSTVIHAVNGWAAVPN